MKTAYKIDPVHSTAQFVAVTTRRADQPTRVAL